MLLPSNTNYFRRSLLAWNLEMNTRQMPWKGEKNPYKIWVSEIILQQTRVEQGIEYYKKFINAFPDISALANAEESLVLKCWEGLGYYSRCRNILHSAKMIKEKFNGRFPENYAEIKSLKGVGDYTAAAISSFAFNAPYAVVDGNVSRLLSRFFGIGMSVDSNAGKAQFAQLAQQLLDKNAPAIYNQAIMDFGAVICKPRSPLCIRCPLNKKCQAFLENRVAELPVKQKLNLRKKRFFYYFLVKFKGKVYVQKRTAKDIWQNLYEFPLIETEKEVTTEAVILTESFGELFVGVKPVIMHQLPVRTQLLTHQSITGSIFIVSINKPLKLLNHMFAVDEKEIAALPFPKFINAYLQDKNVSLKLFQA
ncbi:MAG: A/G-specific adenine glycosylase [Chitinophagaceae bacterium]